MNNSAKAYAKTAQQTLQGRDLEAHVLLKSAARLQGIRDSWDTRKGEVEEALLANRKIWTIFVSGMSADECQLPAMLRSNMINLGMYVFNRTIQMTIDPKPEQLSILIDINRNIAMGLRGNGSDKPAAAA
ncbi:MAG: flagellar biosynthesis regulator FlaF [Beijerinckiaceae bacterium]